MTQEDKDLLLKDLCARLPYGVIVRLDYRDGTIVTREMGIGSLHDMMFDNAEGKPYLRPMSSMTEEELNEFILVTETILGVGKNKYTVILSLDATDWLNAHHFDYRGLIDKDLAIEVTKENNPYEKEL